MKNTQFTENMVRCKYDTEKNGSCYMFKRKNCRNCKQYSSLVMEATPNKIINIILENHIEK